MEKTETIRAVEVVRRIRDAQARQLAGKSDAEVIEYFRRAGEAARKAAHDRLSIQRTSEGNR
jgi:hypothetical protein